MKFGYLNLKSPTTIGDNEAQEATNCRVDRGFIEFASWSIDKDICRADKDAAGRTIRIGPIVPDLFPFPQDLARILASGVYDSVGTSHLFGLPTKAATNIGLTIYPVGNYSYALTAYNPETGEESAPQVFEQYIAADEVLHLTNFFPCSIQPQLQYKTRLQWRLYRMPLGGSEYLRVPHDMLTDAAGAPIPGTYLPALAALAGPIQDRCSDENLGEALDSWENYTPYEWNNSIYSIIRIHNEKLFFRIDLANVTVISQLTSLDLFGNGYAICFSKTGIPGAIPTSNILLFNSKPSGLFTVDESLAILCEKTVHVLYGQTEADFFLKKISSAKTGSPEGYAAAVVNGVLFFGGTDETNPLDLNGIYALSGGECARISDKIDSLFPLSGVVASTPYVPNFGANAIDDRFFVLRTASGYIVFDSKARGFLRGDSTTSFAYRTKEFTFKVIPGQLRTIAVQGKGDFTVEVFGDNSSLGSASFSFATVQKDWFNVDPRKCDTFSFRFTGSAGAEIHDCEVVE